MQTAQITTIAGARKAASEIVWLDGWIAEELPDDTYRLDDGTLACTAASCLLRPRGGDRIVALACGREVFITAILERGDASTAEIGVTGAPELTLAAPRVTVRASETITMQSLRDVDVTAIGGNLSLSARNVVTTAADAIIENMRHYIAHAEAFAVQVKTLLRMHSKTAVVTAEQDIKVDAERISLG
ncbi:MAG TPA: DUF3540 domain-containing protein [Burkholderiales bacterium]|nr:DUF3540 domain-containing protein [Burkholderiales bacterium]